MSERDYDVQWALSTKKQSAYGTALLDASLTKSYPFLGPDILEENIGLETNEEEVGHGEWATEQYQELKDCKLARKFDCGSWLLAWAAAFGLGSITSQQQATTSAYLHTITPQTSSKQLAATTVVERLSSGIKRKVRDLCVTRFKVSGEPKQRLKLEMDLIGSGHIADSVLAMPSLAADSFLRMHGVKLEVGVSGSEVDVSTRLKRFEFEWNNNPLLDDGYYPGSGQVRGRLEHGRRGATLGFDLLLDANSTERTHLVNNDALKAIVTAEGALIEDTYYHKMVLTVPKLKYKALQVGSEDNMLRYSIESSVLYDSVAGYLVQLEVTNTETAFLDTEP